MLDKIFFVNLVLNTSGLFRFIAPQLGISIGNVSAALLALNLVYVVAKLNRSLPVILHGAMGKWLLLLFVWPVTTVVYAPALDIRELGLQLYFFSLFLGTIVFVRTNGLLPMYRMLTISLVITIVGMPLSMLAPQYFEAVAALASTESYEMGRPIGFFMQPNRLAICLCLIFVGWFALWQGKTVVKEVVVILGFLGLELLTGSRAGVLVGLGIATLLLSHNWPKRLASGRLVYTGLLLLILMAVGIVGLRVYLTSFSDAATRRQGDLVDRVQSMISFEFSPEGDLTEDLSIEQRTDAQIYYLSQIVEEPLLGQGFGSITYYLGTGELWLTAHSDALAGAFQYGVFYPLCMMLSVAGLCRARRRKLLERALGTNSVIQFTAAFFVLYAYSSPTETRVTYIVLGLVYALVCYSPQLFDVNSHTGELGAMLTRKEIRARWRQPRTGQPHIAIETESQAQDLRTQ